MGVWDWIGAVVIGLFWIAFLSNLAMMGERAVRCGKDRGKGKTGRRSRREELDWWGR